MDATKQLNYLIKHRKSLLSFGTLFSILCAISVAVVIALTFILDPEDYTILIIIACCVVPLLLLFLALVFFKTASNFVLKIIVAKFVIADFEPTKLYTLNKFHKRFLYLDINKQRWAYAVKTDIVAMRNFNEIEDYEIVLDEDIEYCHNFYFEISYHNFEDPTRLVFFDHKINKDRQKFRFALDTMNEITKVLEKIKSHNQFTPEAKEPYIYDAELNAMRAELEKQRIRTELNKMQEKVCKYCGHKNTGTDAKCASCGAPLDDTTA